MKTRLSVAAVFLIFLLVGYTALGCARHHIYEEEINKSVEKWVAALDEDIAKLQGIEDPDMFYFGAPEAIPVIKDPLYKEMMYSFYKATVVRGAEYQVEVVPQLVKDITGGGWNLWDAYTSRATFRVLQIHAYTGGYQWIDLGPSVSTDIGGSLAESIASWEAAGGKREGNWLESYRQSPEYRTWFNEYVAEISGPKYVPNFDVDDMTKEMIDDLLQKALSEGKSEDDPYVQALRKAKEYAESESSQKEEKHVHEPMSVEERYKNVQEMKELPFWTDFFFGDILRASQRLTNVAYEEYMTHVDEEDIIRAGMDAGVVDSIGDYLDRMEENNYETSFVFGYCAFPFMDLVFDVCILLVFSVVSTIVVTKKVMPWAKSRK